MNATLNQLAIDFIIQSQSFFCGAINKQPEKIVAVEAYQECTTNYKYTDRKHFELQVKKQIKSGRDLCQFSSGDLEAKLGIRHILHRKKVFIFVMIQS